MGFSNAFLCFSMDCVFEARVFPRRADCCALRVFLLRFTPRRRASQQERFETQASAPEHELRLGCLYYFMYSLIIHYLLVITNYQLITMSLLGISPDLLRRTT